MHIFIMVLALCILATLKATLQSAFAKKNVKNTTDGIFFNGLIFIFSSLLFIKDAVGCNIIVILFGTVFGLGSFLYQLFYIKAMACGNVSLTILMVNLSMIIPTTFSAFAYGEKLTPLRLLGIILCLIALTLGVDYKEKAKEYKKWFLFALLAMLANGASTIWQKVFSKTEYVGDSGGFVAWSYLAAAVFSVIMYFVLKTKSTALSFKITHTIILFALSAGIVLGIFQYINTKAVSTIDGTLLFPSFYGGNLITSTLAGVLIFKDKLKKIQIISIIVGVISLVLMSI